MVLLQERNQVSFRVTLQQFLAFADNTEPKFAQYFKDNYCNLIEQWAPCFRHRTAVNTEEIVDPQSHWSFDNTAKAKYNIGEL